MDVHTDIVNLMVKKMVYTEPCMRCGKEISMTEQAHANFMSIASRGICCLLWCEECHKEYEEDEKAKRPARRESPKVLPLP